MRTTRSIIFQQEFHQSCELENPNFSFYAVPLDPNDPWQGRRGRLTPEWVRNTHDLPNTVFDAAGPNEWLSSPRKSYCVEWGVPKEQMKMKNGAEPHATFYRAPKWARS